MRGELTLEEFEQAKAESTVETYELEEQLRNLRTLQNDADRFVRFSQLMLLDMGTLWALASADQKVKVQNLLFDGALEYSRETGILSPSKSSLFSMLETLKSEMGSLVGPPGFEPGTKAL